ncbi:hypothetical protein C5F51_15575 [Nocardia nova]|jgi:Mce-associated membrane protein|uniref:Uncharacterized protein n=2 Tax=Nocardiaceae TaxID=85025 RepID=A0A2S6A6T0_9NOCA|nr:hypothetical protein C5E46_34285 [Nocardia nova]PPJ28222.1 hypothetical protein C5F51_15575 [Nocardia nova]
MIIQTSTRYLRRMASVAADLVPVAIVAAAGLMITSVLGRPLWMEVVCGVVVAAALGFAGWNAVLRRRDNGGRRLLPAAAPPIVALAVLVSLQTLIQQPADRDLANSRDTVAKAASDSAVAVLSYKPETVDQDLAAAKTRLTGDFLETYGKLADTVVAPAAKEKKVTMQAAPVGSAVESVSKDQATVIVYIDQTTTVAGNPAPSQSQNALRVGLTKVGGRWLINRFDPLF